MDQSSWACKSEPPARSAEKFHAPDTRLLSWHGTGGWQSHHFGFPKGAKVITEFLGILGYLKSFLSFCILGNQWWYGGTPTLGTAQCGKISKSFWGTPPPVGWGFGPRLSQLTLIKLVGNISWTKSNQLETLSKCHGGNQKTVLESPSCGLPHPPWKEWDLVHMVPRLGRVLPLASAGGKFHGMNGPWSVILVIPSGESRHHGYHMNPMRMDWWTLMNIGWPSRHVSII